MKNLVHDKYFSFNVIYSENWDILIYMINLDKLNSWKLTLFRMKQANL